ncbi:unnamed protein product [Gordionus sp. m RMFG-2023]
MSGVEQLRVTIGLRLGCDIVQPHACIKCKSPVDSKGRHGLNCIFSQGRHQRHSAVNHIINRSLTAAHIPNNLEPSNLSQVDGLRPDGMTTIPWALGKSLIWDYTCVSSFPSNINFNLITQAEIKKINKCKNFKNFLFTLVVTSTNGHFSP